MVWKNPVEGVDDCGVFDVEVCAVEVDCCEVMEVNNSVNGGCGDTEVEALGNSNVELRHVQSLKEIGAGYLLYYAFVPVVPPWYLFLLGRAGGYNFTTVSAKSSGSGAALLTGLKKYRKYGVVVQAFNEKGPGPTSSEVIAQTLEDAVELNTTSALANYATEAGHIEAETKVTSEINTELHGLQKYSNYSIQVWAYTQIGDGVKSNPIFCVTDEDVPDAPDNIKVVAGSTNSLVVGWLTPSRPNGRITSYTVYQRTLEGGREKDSNKRRLPPTQTHYEVHDLLKGEAHEFWVTAFTRIGEGQSTPVVYATVTTRVPAAIISFGHTMSVRRRGSVQMPCLAVGIPLPERHWFNVEGIHLSGDPFTIQSDGTLHIIEVQRQHQGNYTCSISNANGSDQITYFLRVLVAPSAPVVRVAATSSDWLQLQWSTTDNGGSAIRGYFLNFRKEEGGEWEERAIQRDATFFRLHKLDCGTQYQLQMMAYNAVGSGSPSSVVIAHTDGDIPIKPTYLDFIEVNTSNITLRLKAWGDNGCPIISYSIEYKESSQQDWLTGTLGPDQVRIDSQEEDQPFYLDLGVILPIILSLTLLAVVIAGLFICFHRRSGRERAGGGVQGVLDHQQAMVALDNKQNLAQREQYYAEVQKGIGTHSVERIPVINDWNPGKFRYPCLDPSEVNVYLFIRGIRLDRRVGEVDILYPSSGGGISACPESSTSPELSPLPERRNIPRRHRHNVSSPNQDSNLDLPILGSLSQHETSAFANYVTEAPLRPDLTGLDIICRPESGRVRSQ
uniref:Down syndrome cell adhesion molecule-like protein Dscam2 n=1 Tax=Timema douglasi TaxID=61478 RepID=A0A7R8V928_TIMDO|nr:unnamed protein product [Timema douglasi]